jgi:hypothetical protein
MNEFTAKNEQAFLDACGAIGVEPGWKLKSCITLTQRRYGHPEGVNLTTLMPGSHDPGVAAPHCDRHGHVEGRFGDRRRIGPFHSPFSVARDSESLRCGEFLRQKPTRSEKDQY